MRVIKIILASGQQYVPVKGGRGFNYDGVDYTHQTWDQIVLHVKSAKYASLGGAKFITDKPFNKEDWL